MRILEVVSDLDGGGVDRLMLDYCSRMTPEIKFDFVTVSNRTKEGILEEPLKQLGCNIFHVRPIRDGLFIHLKEVQKIIKRNSYDVVHCHGNYRNIDFLIFSKLYGIKKRIAHSHIAYIDHSLIQQVLKKPLVCITKMLATDLYACGEDAAVWMWGEKDFLRSKVTIMKNAIEIEKFVYSEVERNRIRTNYNLLDKYVIGCVARLSYQKNYPYLIDIFYEVKKIKDNVILMIIGQGEQENEIKEYVASKGLQDDVLFLGVRNDVNKLLNAMDVFVLPSRFEGLGIVYIEAQVNGLTCFGSKDLVPTEANVAGMLHYLSINEEPIVWAEEIVNSPNRMTCSNASVVAKAGFDINVEAAKQKCRYLDMR